MENIILRTDADIRPLATAASVDTVELFLRRPPAGLRKRVESVTGQRPHIEGCLDWSGRRRGVRLIVNRPSRDALKLMAGLVGNRWMGCCVSRVDLAVDFVTDDEDQARALTDWLDRHIVLKWRSARSAKVRVEDAHGRVSVYWTDKRRARNLVVYPKASNVVRLELRFLNAGAVKRSGLHEVEKLEMVDVNKLIRHHLKAERLSERHITNIVRKTYKQDMMGHQKSKPRRYHPVIDLYRSRIPARVRSILTRADMQTMRPGRGTEKIDMDGLNIPQQVTLG